MELKEALEKSIAQWELMVKDPCLRKKDAYIKTGGKRRNINSACFLCNAFSKNRCKGCLTWNITSIPETRVLCRTKESPFREWVETEIETEEELEATKKMLKYLKEEFKKL